MIVGYVTGQELRMESPVVVADTVNYLSARFVFRNKDWDGLAVRAVFAFGESSFSFPLTDGMIRQKDGLNLSAGAWRVHLVGSSVVDGVLAQRITTNPAEIMVQPTGGLGGGLLPEIPATDVERLAAKDSEQDERIRRLEEGSGGGSGGVDFVAGNALELTEDGELNVKTTDKAEAGNVLPITSEGVNAVAVELWKTIGNKLDATELTKAINTALAHAKESGEFDGDHGISPHIGDNGNWFVGNTDTGVQAQGEDYVLTEFDKIQIAGIVLSEIPKYNGEVEDA